MKILIPAKNEYFNESFYKTKEILDKFEEVQEKSMGINKNVQRTNKK